jgi:hypothetical protein
MYKINSALFCKLSTVLKLEVLMIKKRPKYYKKSSTITFIFHHSLLIDVCMIVLVLSRYFSMKTNHLIFINK